VKILSNPDSAGSDNTQGISLGPSSSLQATYSVKRHSTTA